jgi:protocatechuate 3,4-dioxygenase beta subunit
MSKHPIEVDEHDDDIPVGRVLSRREVMKLFGGGGLAMLAGFGLTRLGLNQLVTATPTATATTIPTCVAKPALTEGPYFSDVMLNRSDIRTNTSDGTIVEGPILELIVRVFDLNETACTPLPNVQVDIWHCDVDGVYSDAQDQSFDTTGMDFLRGYQITDENGQVKFITIYPGWYEGRAVHIHFKMRTDPESETGYEFTSQFFFDDAFSDEVYEQEPYASRTRRSRMNEDDNIYQSSNGELTLVVEKTEEGYRALFDIALDLTDISGSSESGGGPGSGGMGTPPSGGGRPGTRATATPTPSS